VRGSAVGTCSKRQLGNSPVAVERSNVETGTWVPSTSVASCDVVILHETLLEEQKLVEGGETLFHLVRDSDNVLVALYADASDDEYYDTYSEDDQIFLDPPDDSESDDSSEAGSSDSGWAENDDVDDIVPDAQPMVNTGYGHLSVLTGEFLAHLTNMGFLHTVSGGFQMSGALHTDIPIGLDMPGAFVYGDDTYDDTISDPGDHEVDGLFDFDGSPVPSITSLHEIEDEVGSCDLKRDLEPGDGFDGFLYRNFIRWKDDLFGSKRVIPMDAEASLRQLLIHIDQ